MLLYILEHLTDPYAVSRTLFRHKLNNVPDKRANSYIVMMRVTEIVSHYTDNQYDGIPHNLHHIMIFMSRLSIFYIVTIDTLPLIAPTIY